MGQGPRPLDYERPRRRRRPIWLPSAREWRWLGKWALIYTLICWGAAAVLGIVLLIVAVVRRLSATL